MHVDYIRNFLRDLRDQLTNECYRLHSHNNLLLGHAPATPSMGTPEKTSEPTCFASEYQMLVQEIMDKMSWLAAETDRAISITAEKGVPTNAQAR